VFVASIGERRINIHETAVVVAVSLSLAAAAAATPR